MIISIACNDNTGTKLENSYIVHKKISSVSARKLKCPSSVRLRTFSAWLGSAREISAQTHHQYSVVIERYFPQKIKKIMTPSFNWSRPMCTTAPCTPQILSTQCAYYLKGSEQTKEIFSAIKRSVQIATDWNSIRKSFLHLADGVNGTYNSKRNIST